SDLDDLDIRRLHARAVRLGRWTGILLRRALHARISLRPRFRPPAARRGGGAFGSSVADSDRDLADAPAADDGGAVVSVALFSGRPGRRPYYRLRRLLVEAGSVALGAIIVIWSLIPVYNMFLVALDPVGHNEFAGESGRRTRRSPASSHCGPR